MAKDKVGVNGGQWYVEVGKLDSGKQPRVYLGRVTEVAEDEARVRRHRVRQFWKRYTEHNRLNPWCRGYWSAESLDMAKLVAKGGTRLVYDVPVPAEQLVAALGDLNRHFEGVATFGAAEAQHEPVRAVRDAARVTLVNAHRAVEVAPIGDDGSEPIHHWLGKFAEYALDTKQTFNEDKKRNETSEWGHQSAKQIGYLTSHVPNVPLSALDYNAIERVVVTLTNRPVSEKTNKPISVKYVGMLLKQWKAFIRWLPKQTTWKKPEDWDEAFRYRPKKSKSEKEAKAVGTVDAYTVEQLPLIYRYATPYERVLFLLALNCGFGAIELTYLSTGQCYVNRGGDSFIKRVRLKSDVGVYGEHWLWPQTTEAIEWSRARTEQILGRPLTSTDPLIVRTNGERLVKVIGKSGNRSNKAANAWDHLAKRIQKDYPDFPTLSFGKLRKTGGNLVKQFTDGEIVAVYHQRASAVKTDDEAEVYTNRDYPKVFAAQEKVYELLRPMLESEATPFGTTKKMYTSHSTVARIVQLWAEGVPPMEIVKRTGRSRATVYRNRPVTA